MTGGNVFNSKYQDVLNWFWRFFDKETEFVKTSRNAVIQFDNGIQAKYPIENHLYMLDIDKVKLIIRDLLYISKTKESVMDNFDNFLKNRFGVTLYEYYFRPYNEKIWKRNLKNVPLNWLEGKLPMPSVEEILINNFFHIQEREMVHSSFYYPKNNGSQFIADKLANNLNIQYNSDIKSVERNNNNWCVDNQEFEKIIFCGNIKNFPRIFAKSLDINSFNQPINELEFHGTTSVLCKIEQNPFSWIYLPSNKYLSHRIICTGNFSSSNNAQFSVPTCTVEFTDYISKEDIEENLSKMPFSVNYITHNYAEFTYPIQNQTTKEIITGIKKVIEKDNVYLLGRFAEWEYYNMDTAIKAAMNLVKNMEYGK